MTPTGVAVPRPGPGEVAGVHRFGVGCLLAAVLMPCGVRCRGHIDIADELLQVGDAYPPRAAHQVRGLRDAVVEVGP